MGNCLSRQTRRERQDTELSEECDTNVCHSNIDNEGYKAMLACHDKLVTAIATDYLTIAGILLACGFISEEVSSKMLLPSSTPTEKATILVTAMRERIKIAPQHFSELVRILSRNTSTECIVSLLQSTYQGKIGCSLIRCLHALLYYSY